MLAIKNGKKCWQNKVSAIKNNNNMQDCLQKETTSLSNAKFTESPSLLLLKPNLMVFIDFNNRFEVRVRAQKTIKLFFTSFSLRRFLCSLFLFFFLHFLAPSYCHISLNRHTLQTYCVIAFVFLKGLDICSMLLCTLLAHHLPFFREIY